jgi:uncharacterized protein
VSLSDILSTVGVVAIAAMLQAAVGFGFALVAMPLLAAVWGSEQALAVVSLVALVNSATTAVTARGHAHRATLGTITIAALAGMPFGVLALEHFPERAMRLAIAGSVAVAAGLLAFGVRIRKPGRGTNVVSGVLSGALSTSTGTSGPPLVVGLQSQSLPAPVVRSTLAAQFAITGVVSTGLLAARGHIDGDDVWLAALCIPVTIVMWQIGARLFHRFDQRRYDRVVVLLLVAAAAIGAWNAR